MVLTASVAHGQLAPNEPAVLGKTTLGQSQNDDRDLANSLIAGPQKYGKGEKKAQVNAAELKSKSIKDATFGGSLLNIGIGSAAEPKLDASKEHAAPSEEEPSKKTKSTAQNSSTAEQPAPEQIPAGVNQPRISESGFSFSSLSQTATLADDLGQPDTGAASTSASKPAASSSGDTSKKDQGGAQAVSSTNSNEKPSEH